MPTHTATIRTIHRDPTRRDGIPCRLITLTLDDGITARLTYKQAAQLPFWLKPGQRIEITGTLNEDTLNEDTLNEGDFRDNILHITELHLLDHPDPTPRPWLRHRRLTAFDPIDLEPIHLLILLIIAIIVAILIVSTRY